jgi:biotin synthase
LEHKGREKGILSGANVIMPNITPEDMRKKYLLYNNKYNGSLKENILQSPLQQQMQDIGYEIVIDRGDYCV